MNGRGRIWRLALLLAGVLPDVAHGQSASPRVAAIRMLVDSQRVAYPVAGVTVVRDDSVIGDDRRGQLAASRTLDADAAEIARMIGHGAITAGYTEALACRSVSTSSRGGRGAEVSVRAHTECASANTRSVIQIGAARTDGSGITRVRIVQTQGRPTIGATPSGAATRVIAIVQVKWNDRIGWLPTRLERVSTAAAGTHQRERGPRLPYLKRAFSSVATPASTALR